MTVRLISAGTLARILAKDERTIARWCRDGDIEHCMQGHGRARRYLIVVRDNVVRVCDIPITIELNAA